MNFFPKTKHRFPQRPAGASVQPYLLAALVGAAYATPAVAEISDTIHPYVSVVYLHDDNLLRLDDGQSIDGQRSDNYRQAIAGVSIEQPIGRQQLSADLHVSRVTFSHFDEYDYNGKDAQASLAWQIANHLSGHLGGTYSQTLAPFSDFNNVGRNLRVQRSEFVDAAWQFHPRWQLRSAYTRYEYRYDLDELKYNNRNEDSALLGIDYLEPGGSRIGFQVRRLEGDYPTGTLFGFLVSDNYKQDEAKLNIYWRYSAITQVQFTGGYARRQHDVYSNRDQSGANARVTAFWLPTVKTKVTANLWREFTAVEGGSVNSALSKGASVDASWQATAKLALGAQLRSEKREFNAINAAVISDPHDTTRSASLSLTYNPLTNVQLATSVSHNDRTGNFVVGSGNYKSNSVSLSAQISF